MDKLVINNSRVCHAVTIIVKNIPSNSSTESCVQSPDWERVLFQVILVVIQSGVYYYRRCL